MALQANGPRWFLHLCAANDRAKDAESRLRAVSEALSQENLPRKVPAGQFHKAELVSSPNDVATLLNQLRAIVEGK